MTTATRTYNRAAKGGMVSPVNGRFYKGGQFMPAPAAKDAWAIRPTTTPTGLRRFIAVAKLASGEEVPCYKGNCSFDSIREARLFIIVRYDGGRAFPAAPKPVAHSAAYWAEDSRIADSFKGLRAWRA